MLSGSFGGLRLVVRVLPKGEGKFEWSNESFYVGNWSKDDHSATYYPSTAKFGVEYSGWNQREVFLMDLVDAFSIRPMGKKVLVLPWQKIQNYDRKMQGKKKKKQGGGRKEWGLGERGLDRICVWQTNGDITCDIVVGSSAHQRRTYQTCKLRKTTTTIMRHTME